MLKYHLSAEPHAVNWSRVACYNFNEQFPPEINSERKELVKVMKEKRQQGHKTRLVYNKLYVDDILYKPPTKQTHPNA